MILTKNVKDNDLKKQIKIIHSIPNLSDVERESIKKIISNDLHEIFFRIQSKIKFESECINS